MNVLKRLLGVLKRSIEDVQDHPDDPTKTVSHRNVAIFYQYRRNGLFGRELDVRARIKSPDGLAGQPNAWVLTPKLLALFDGPPSICWLRNEQAFVQITGRLRGKEVTVNLW